MAHAGRETSFYAWFLLSLGGLAGQSLSANLITMYLFFETVTLMSMPLVLHDRTKESIRAALKYLFYSVAGAFLALAAIFFLARYSTTLDFKAGGNLDPALVQGHETLLQVVIFLGVVGFGAKAGLYPLHGWLPTAHPVAPAPASAVLSGLIAKAGVLAIIRLIFFSVGTDFLFGTWVQKAWLGLSLLTVFMGSMMAYREKVFKKRLAYSSVSQISYVLTGLFLMTPQSVQGGLLHVIFHASIKICLFLVAGSFIVNAEKHRVDELKGYGRAMPITLWSFTLAALALVGIPPASGFVSKWYLATGALDSGLAVFSWLAPVILLISALLTAGYLLPITIDGFFPGRDFKEIPPKNDEGGPLMWVPILFLGILTVLLGLFSGGLSEALAKLAASIIP
jgi:multicomponent Na+:H+ antiporter subunit D